MDVTGAGKSRYEMRRGTPADHPAVRSFTTDTWGERSDYVPSVYPRWMETESDRQRTFVAVDPEADPPADPTALVPGDESVPGEASTPDDHPDGRAVGVCQAVRLTAHEGWVQAMRVDPDHRGEGLSTLLNDAAVAWLAERGCVVARNMVFSWNAAGLGGSRAAGFEPCTEFRWAHPDPDSEPGLAPDRGSGATADRERDGEAAASTADAAWTFWQGSDARTHLRGLALDAEESWALSELTRNRLRTAANDGRLLTVRDGGVRAFSVRNRTYDRENDEGEAETWAEYAVAVWADVGGCSALMDAVARDAAAVGADRTRVLIPETVRWVSDAAVAGVAVSEEPDFVLAADLTRRPWDRN